MKRASLLASILLCIVALGHLLRLVFGVEVLVGGRVIPFWVSVVGVLVPTALAVALCMESRSQ